jgi:hypothetical protein
MLAVMGQSADQLFSTVNGQVLRIFAASEAAAAVTGGQPSSRGGKYALNIMLQGMNVPQIAAGISSVGAAAGALLLTSCWPAALLLVPCCCRWCRTLLCLAHAAWLISCQQLHPPAARTNALHPHCSPQLLAQYSITLPSPAYTTAASHAVQATLRESVSLLLLKLMEDKSLLRFEEGATLVKAVNVLMLKILEARWVGGWGGGRCCCVC